MGLFSKKTLKDLLAQRKDGTLSNQVGPLFYPDATWAYEKDTGLPAMFRFSARLGDIPYSVHILGKKDKGAAAIGRSYYGETVDARTYIDILKEKGSLLRGTVPFFMEMYGMKEDLIDRCGTLEQLFADASYDRAMEALKWAEERGHAGAQIIKNTLNNYSNDEDLFPFKEPGWKTYPVAEYNYHIAQHRFLLELYRYTLYQYNNADWGKPDLAGQYSDLLFNIRCVVIWLAMHKVPWACMEYWTGRMFSNDQSLKTSYFPAGYYYSNISADYYHDDDRRDKVLGYSREKAFKLWNESIDDDLVIYHFTREFERLASNDSTEGRLEEARLNFQICMYDEAFAQIYPLIREGNKEALELAYKMLFEGQVTCTTDMETALLVIRHKIGRKDPDKAFEMINRLYTGDKIC